MANVGNIEYTVSVETQQSINAAQQFDKQMDQVQDSARKTDRELGKLDTGFSKLATAIKGVIAVSALRSMAGMVQEYQTMAERVKMATRSTEEFETVQKRLQTTADGTYRSLAEAQELYIRTADSIRSMGYTLEETIDIQDSMSYAFVTNATSADRAQAAISQFTKSINTGKVSADQWETISSAIPTVMNDIAAASGKSASEVRALGAAGKLTARELTEGLRKSLDETRAASDSMATDLIDASVRAKNAITTVLVGLENQTGAIQAVTDGIISASEAMLEFGQDAEKMEAFLKLATVAGASLAAVMAGRMLTAMVAGTQALYANTIAARAKAAAELQAAQTAAALAAQNLVQAQTAARAAVGLGHQAQAAAALTAAENAATTATARLTAAQSTMAGAFSVAAAAAGALRTALAFLGGPAGIILLVGAAFLTMGRNAKISAEELDNLGETIGELGQKTLEYRKVQLEEALREQEAAAAKLERKYKDLNRQLDEGLMRSEGFRRKVKEVGAQAEEASAQVNQLEDSLHRVNNELDKRASGADVGPQKQETEQLVTEQNNLEGSLTSTTTARKQLTEAEREAIKAAEDLNRGIEQNADTIAALEEQMRQAEMSAGELAQRQAELSLNEYATPEQIARIKELGAALRENAEAEERDKMRQAAVAADPRTEAANQYAEQLAAYQQYKEQELLTDQQYNELKNAAATEYEQARLAAQEEMFRAQSAGNDFMMGSIDALGNASTNVISGLLSGTMNTKEAMQALGNTIFQHAVGALVEMGVQHVKSLVMGQTAQTAAAGAAMATGSAVAAAWAPAAAAVSLATLGANSGPAMAGITATYGATSAMSVVGARRQGGPVAAGSMYRVNEGGAPEIFQNNLGQQYMMPNSRGEVISNKDASKGGGAGGTIVNIYEAANTSAEVTTTKDDQGRDVIDIVLQNLLSDGELAGAVGRITGTQYQGV